MADALVVTGMVLKTMPIGDYDKRITLLTKERGKITAFARGCRRPNSQLLACTNPFVFGEFELFEGKSSYTLAKASISNYFRDLTEDFSAVYLGFYFLEFADYFCQENNDEKEMLKLLYQTMRALESPKFDRRLVRFIFELKAMTINGEGPSVFSCIHCRKKEDLILFSVKKGGMFCKNCLDFASGRKISEAALYTLQYVESVEIKKLYSFSLKEEVLKELIDLMKEYLATYLHHDFNSLSILETIC